MTQAVAKPRLLPRFVGLLLPLLGAGMWSTIPLAQAADDSALSTRMEHLERDMRQLQQDFYANSGQGTAAAPPAGGTSSDYVERLNSVEQSLRDLRGQIEETGFKQRQILERLDAIELKLGMSPPANQSGEASPVPLQPSASATASPPASETPGVLGTLPASSTADAPAAPAPTDAKGQFDAAIATLYQGKRDAGIEALQAFIEAHPKDKRVPEAYYWMGEAELADKAYKEAGDAFLAVVTKYPKDPMAPKSLVKLGSTLIAGGQTKEGCNQLKSIKKVFPKADKSIVDMADRERKLGHCS